MKVSTLILAFSFFLITGSMHAQLSIGLKGGYIRAWEEYGNVELPPNAKIHVHGYQGSVLCYLNLSKTFSIGIEPGYAQRGAACQPGFIVFNSDTKLLLNYLDLPLMVSARIPAFRDKFSFFGKAGYGISRVITGYTEVTDLTGVEPVKRTKLDFTNPFGDNISRRDHGLYGSLGMAYNFGVNHLFIESTLYYGLVDVDINNKSENRSIHVGIGYLVNL